MHEKLHFLSHDSFHQIRPRGEVCTVGPEGYPRVLDYLIFKWLSNNVTARSSSRELKTFTFLSNHSNIFFSFFILIFRIWKLLWWTYMLTPKNVAISTMFFFLYHDIHNIKWIWSILLSIQFKIQNSVHKIELLKLKLPFELPPQLQVAFHHNQLFNEALLGVRMLPATLHTIWYFVTSYNTNNTIFWLHQ